MKHKTLRTLLCVILTVCFCLSAIVPASAAGLFGGDSGAATGWDQLIRGLKDLKDRIIEKNPGTDETPAEPMAGTGDEFIRIFHLDCGRKYFTVKEIENIIEWIAANHYTHIELAFGNDGFRFLLDDMAVGGYTSDQVKAAITAGNEAYNKECNYSPEKNELTQTEMDGIITYAASKGISVIPMLDVPGHAKALIEAMVKLGMSVDSEPTGNNNMGYPMYAFKAGDNDATKFAVDLVKKYVDYFKLNGSKYFNIAGDECGYSSFVKVDELVPNLITPLSSYILDSGMKPMMFNDAFRLDNELKVRLQNSGIIICYWTNGDAYDKVETLANVYKYTIINTHNKWYYIAGKEKPLNSSWAGTAFSYTWAIANMTNGGNPGEGDFRDCTACDGNYKTSTGCMVAFWCDKPGATVNYSNLKTYIETLPKQNPNYFKAAEETPLPTIVIGGNSTELTVGENVIMSTSDGSLAAWSSSNPAVLTLKDNDAVEKALLSETSSVTVQAVGAGEAAITAVLGNGNTISTASIKVKTADTATERNITVTVGGTSTNTINGANYKNGTWTVENESIATISVDGVDATEGSGEYSYAGRVYVSDLAGSYTQWTKTEYSHKVGTAYYPIYAYKKQNANTTYYYYSYSTDNGETFSKIGYREYTTNQSTIISVYKETIASTPASTTVTFNGIAAGTTYVTVGHVRYTIKVTAEDLANVPPLPIQTWITNYTVETTSETTHNTTDSYWAANWSVTYDQQKYARYVNISAEDVYGENGKAIAEFMPNNLTGYEYGGTYWNSNRYDSTAQAKKLVVWNGQVHNSSNIQKIYGKDYSNTGTEFKYVRYFADKWEVSATGEENSWTEVHGYNSQSSEQIAVYYMIRSTITDEVTTDIADWGSQYPESSYISQVQNTSDYFVLLDFAVKYESGDRVPDQFAVNNKTFAFHCRANDTGGAVHQYGSYYYRDLNNFRVVDTSEYEVYMVTVTMTNDQANETLTATSAQTVGGYTYDGKEQVLWAIDQKTRDAASNLNDYTSISSSSTYSGCKIGNDPYIRGVEVYRQHGALITYYVRVKEVPVENDVIHVHYIDRATGEEFYTYPIIVIKDAQDGLFDEGFGINPTTRVLEKNTVKNHLGKTQTVESDLTKMYGVPAQYRYSEIKFVDANLGTGDIATARKDAYLYYEFKSDVSFVVDFGLPITIPYTDLNDKLGATEVRINTITPGKATYGVVTVNTDNDGKPVSVTYTPNTIINSTDSFTVKCFGTVPRDEPDENGNTYYEGDVTYTVQIIPATNVYYEETFIKNNGWTVDPGQTQNQALEKPGAKQNVYGYDPKVANQNANIGYSMGGVYKTTLSLTDLSDTSYMFSNPLTFTFEGTGLDLISACNTNTGMLYVEVIGKEKGGAYRALVDTYFRGDDSIIVNGETVYQVPVVRKLDLPYDMYTVTIKGYLYNGAGTVVKASTNAVAEVNSFSSYMVEEDALSTLVNALAIPGLTEEDIDVIYMDENSILNPNAAVAAADRSMAAYALDVASNAAATAEVYVDGFRVYNPLGSSGTVVYEEKDANNEVVASHESYISLTDNDAYKKDNEAGVVYYPVYDFIKNSAADLSELDDVIGVYIEYDGKTGVSAIADYKNQGPQNEVYLAPNCAIAFGINGFNSGDVLDVSARKVYGDSVLTDPNGHIDSINSTEMYYSIGYTTTADGTNKPYVLLQNVGAGVIAISGIKVSSNIEPYMDGELAKAIVEKLNPPAGDQSFTPVTFEVKTPKSNPKANRNFVVNVKASAYRGEANDVTRVTLSAVKKGTNEVAVESHDLTPSNTRAVTNKVSKNWNFNELCKLAAGTYTFTITAYNGAGETAVYTVDVTVVN